MKAGDKNLLKKAGGVTLDVVATLIDTQLGGLYITAALGLARGYYGNSLDRRNERALEFIELFQKEIGLIGIDNLKSEDFQDGFVFALEKYIRQRSAKKRKIIQKIFFGFATTQDQSDFDLERYINVLESLSLSGLNYLIFVHKVLKPRYIKMLEERIIPLNLEHYTNHQDAFEDLYKRFNMLDEIKGIEDQEPPEGLLDLEPLGIVRTNHISTIGGGIDETSFTSFGYKFLDFFEEEILN